MNAKLYVASRASIPARSALWRTLRDQAGWPIISTWIDEAGPGETKSFKELWARINAELRQADGLILYVEQGDMPVKGALIEAGMCLGMGKPVAICTEVDLGSWSSHPLVARRLSLSACRQWINYPPPLQQYFPKIN